MLLVLLEISGLNDAFLMRWELIHVLLKKISPFLLCFVQLFLHTDFVKLAFISVYPTCSLSIYVIQVTRSCNKQLLCH